MRVTIRRFGAALPSVLFCILVLYLTLKTKVVFVQHILIMVLKMQFSTCFD